MTNLSKFISRLVAVLMVFVTLGGAVFATTLVFSPVSTYAQLKGATPDFSNKGCIGGAALCNIGKSGDTRTAISDIIVNIATFLIYILGAISVLFIVYGGYLYVTDDGSGSKAGQGKKIVLQALVGLIIALAAFTLVQITLSIVGNLNLGASNSSSPSSGTIQQ